jgi:CRP/FNR family transcriptional regulator, cyclic AMP receptor protein
MTSVTDKIETFFSAYPLQQYEKGHLLVRAGDNPPGVMYLVSGEVRQYDITKQGDEIVVNVFKPSAFFPMSWALNQSPNDYFFEAASDVSLRLAPAEAAVALLEDNPDILLDLLRRVYKGTDGLLRRLAHSLGGTAQSRLVFELVVQSKRFGQPQRDGGVLLPLRETEIAARAGLSRETVSRCMKNLKKAGLLDVTPDGIMVTSIDKLEASLGDDL